jgi:hypothetical protein
MTQRRRARDSMVRPRPASNGRPATPKPGPRPSTTRATGRIAPRRVPPPQQRLPLPARGLLAIGVVGVGILVLVVAAGALGTVGGAVAGAVGGLVDRVTATPTPSPTPVLVLESPTLTAPSQPYTNQPTITLVGAVPADAVGEPDRTIRIRVATGGGEPTILKEIAAPATATFTIPEVALVEGANDFTATIVGPDDVESEPSAIVTYVLDTEVPALTLTSPADGDTVNRETVEIVGRTQGLSEVVARNEANGASVAGTAEGDGAFTLQVPLATGPNGITVTATDPAGNQGTAVLAIRRGAGKLTADIGLSDYRIGVKSLPEPLTVRVVVTDPDGRPLAGATVLFTLTIPGVAPIVPSPVETNAEGVATFKTTVPDAATPGTGPVQARVTAGDLGEVTARTVITIVP